MQLSLWDGIAFVAFILLVVGVSLYASRREESSEDYFLAGRNLTWWLIGISLIASNISTEHFIGMAGAGYGSAGLAIASYEWIAAISLVVVGLALIPLFLRIGIYTMPEFLEHRFGHQARAVMAVYMMVAYVVVAVAGVLYSGAIGLKTIFGLDMTVGIWLIGILAGGYTIYGGLKAVVWSDLIQGSALLIGGSIIAWIALQQVGGLGEFLAANDDKLHMVLPADHPEIPWTALLLGIWIPNFFYWGFNQFITQRTLGARSLKAAQNGIMLAAGLKLLIPFIVVFPGIIALQLFADKINSGDQAYAVLVQELVPSGFRGLMFAALFGAIMSSLDSMLNSTSTIFTMDIFKRYWRPDAGPRDLVRIGRWATAAAVLAGIMLAPLPGRFEGVYRYMQMIWGFISPAITAVFIFGIAVRKAPLAAGMAGLLLGPVIYGLLLVLAPGIAFLNHMAITFISLMIVMSLITIVRPLAEPVTFRSQPPIDMTPSRYAKGLGAGVVLATVMLYVVFW